MYQVCARKLLGIIVWDASIYDATKGGKAFSYDAGK